MKLFRKVYLLIGLLIFCSQIAMAQMPPAPSNETNFIDGFYASGKIMVVVVGLALVLTVLVFYLFRLERKLTKIENEK